MNRFLIAIGLILALMVSACSLPTIGSGANETATSEPAGESATVPSADEAITDTAGTTDDTTDAADDTATTDSVDPGAVADVEPAERNGIYNAPPEMVIDPEQYYYATIQTEQGDIRVQLFTDRAPTTVNNFVFLAREGFYDNTTFHRVIEDFMAQAGDPTGTGTGGPGYQFADEFDSYTEFDRGGLLAMANSGPGTNGSQFFITYEPTPWLNGLHTIFGEVIEGQEVLESLSLRDPMAASEPGDLIETITIEEAESSELPTPTPAPPTPTPLPTPTPFAASSLDVEGDERPLADVPGEEKAGYFNAAPEMVIDAEQNYTATITTSQGDLTVQLFAAEAPVAVNNFVVLANVGFYDNTPVNQVDQQVMVIGSPNNVPSGDAGYVFTPELGLERELGEGAVGYIPVQGSFGESSSSQLIVSLIPPPAGATQQFSFFGQIVDGTDVLTTLTGEDTIESITIEQGE